MICVRYTEGFKSRVTENTCTDTYLKSKAEECLFGIWSHIAEMLENEKEAHFDMFTWVRTLFAFCRQRQYSFLLHKAIFGTECKY